MTFKKLYLLILVLASFTSCTTSQLNFGSDQSLDQASDNQAQPQAQNNIVPNQYGWDSSNCAYIMADGNCAHPTSTHILSPPAPNQNGWNSTNCAHIMADGTCAHPL